MIKADFILVIGVFFCIAVIVSLATLLWREYCSRADFFDVNADAAEYLRQCPYCGHMNIDYRQRQIARCSVCLSYMEDDNV